jgi:dolichyl-phosphate-mannose--protein O-mannosyl transferase
MYYFVHYTSALTSTIGSIAVKIELIVEDAAVSGENDPLTWIGITVVVLSIVLYGYASYQLKLSQDAAATKPADEKTPLAEVVTK